MAKSGGNRSLRVTVEGIEHAEKIPGWLEEGQRKMLEKATDRLAESVQKAVGRHARHEVTHRVISSVQAEIRGGKLVRAAQLGAYIKSRRGPGTAIRFNAGGERFVRSPRGTRLPARKAVDKGLRPRRRIIQETFNEVFDNLEGGPH